MICPNCGCECDDNAMFCRKCGTKINSFSNDITQTSIDKIDKTYEEIIKDSNSDIVMFMYNSSGFDSMVKAMIDKGIK